MQMSTHTHIDDFTGLDALDPVTTPARDATHFRQIRAARAGVEQIGRASCRERV